MLRILRYLVVTIAVFINSVYADIPSFYKDPSISNPQEVIQKVQKGINSAEQQQHEELKEIGINLLTLIFKFHPTLVESIKPEVKNYSDTMQQVIAQSIINSGGSSKNVPDKYQHLKKNDLNFPADYTSIHDVRNVRLTDLNWMAFYISGDKIYIEKILKFLNLFPQNIKILSYEIDNRRNLNMVMQKIGGNSAEQISNEDIFKNFSKQEIAEAFCYGAAKWSMDSNCNQHPEIDDIVKELISKNKNLDYDDVIREMMSKR